MCTWNLSSGLWGLETERWVSFSLEKIRPRVESKISTVGWVGRHTPLIPQSGRQRKLTWRPIYTVSLADLQNSQPGLWKEDTLSQKKKKEEEEKNPTLSNIWTCKYTYMYTNHNTHTRMPKMEKNTVTGTYNPSIWRLDWLPSETL